MNIQFTRFRHFVLIFTLLPPLANAQFYPEPLGSGPWVFSTYEQDNVRLSVIVRGINEPIGMVFVPETATADNSLGDILVTERRSGQVRLVRNGELQAEPAVALKDSLSVSQLFDINLHPRFADNRLLYFTFVKEGEHPDCTEDLCLTTAVARGTWNGNSIVDVEEVFEADAWASHIGGASTRGLFLPDGTFIFGSSHRIELEKPQRLDSHIGKTLRINDDGTAPADNPFYATEGALPEIYTWGNRSVMGFTIHPETGEVWELENGPQGGDEVNILKPGANYGWPVVTYGRDYDGTRFNDVPWVDGTEPPEVFWVPAITVAGMDFYTGDAFPNWQGNLFVTSMMVGRIPGTGRVERIVFNGNGEIRRESMFGELGQRIRFVTEGPDGLLYLLTDHTDGVLVKVEPVATSAADQEAQLQELISQGLTEPGLFLASDCMICHRVNERLVGPSFAEIAARYDADDETIRRLIQSIVEGGEGVWGDVAMTSHPNLTGANVRDMVVQILGL